MQRREKENVWMRSRFVYLAHLGPRLLFTVVTNKTTMKWGLGKRMVDLPAHQPWCHKPRLDWTIWHAACCPSNPQSPSRHLSTQPQVPTQHLTVHPYNIYLLHLCNCLFFSVNHRQVTSEGQVYMQLICICVLSHFNDFKILFPRVIYCGQLPFKCYLGVHCLVQRHFDMQLGGARTQPMVESGEGSPVVCGEPVPNHPHFCWSVSVFLSVSVLLSLPFPHIHAADTTWCNTHLLDSFDQRGFQHLLFTLCTQVSPLNSCHKLNGKRL